VGTRWRWRPVGPDGVADGTHGAVMEVVGGPEGYVTYQYVMAGAHGEMAACLRDGGDGGKFGCDVEVWLGLVEEA
jgi:hypothetical protein